MTRILDRARARRPVTSTAVALAGLAALTLGCGARPGTPAPAGGPSAVVTAAAGPGGPIFTDVAAASGLSFVRDNGMSGRLLFAEMMGSGGALLDYDNDGDLDVFMPQGHLLGTDAEMATAAAEPGARARLYRNDLAPGPDGRPAPRFTDVTDASGLDARGYGFAVATGDYDNDGWTDVYLANLGHNQLWRNRGDGTFVDVTAAAGVDDPRWSSGAAFVDYDRDGWLDLAVVNYNQYTVAADHPCYDQKSGRRDYCGPTAYPSQPSTLFHNRGDGTFEDVTAATGFAATYGPALGVIAADFNRDGWSDVLVANDGQPNTLWVNNGGKRFTEEALMRGVAVNRAGAAEANMGVAAVDVNSDCADDLFTTHIGGETNTLWLNDGTGLFEDRTPDSGLGPVSLPYTGFGVGDMDYDGDGLPDLFVTNGAVLIRPEQAATGDPLPLREPALLFHNLGGGRFADVSAQAGAEVTQPAVGRGVAVGDVDNDGAADLLVTFNQGPVQLLRNNVGAAAPWLGLRLVGADGRRDQLGAEATLTLSDGRQICRRAHSDGSYASAQDPRVLAGLSGGAQVTGLAVTWPDGQREQFDPPALGQYHTLRQGSGRPAGGS
jgi:enediyne biosynthesis protein E4